MDIEISDSDEPLNKSKGNASRLNIRSPSLDEDFVNINSEINDYSTDEDVVYRSENDDTDEEWQQVKDRI